jgi:uncharacterized protein (TIGR01777 family)
LTLSCNVDLREEIVKIVIAGGTGFIGTALARQWVGRHHVIVLTRDLSRAKSQLGNVCECVRWDAEHSGDWEQALNDSEAIVNLAGAPVADARWTAARKRVLVDSRLHATKALASALARAARKPSVLINASGIGYYGASDDRVLDERADRGKGFLADLSAAWEAETSLIHALGIRVVCLRIGLVLEKDGGALPRMALPFRLFAGGPVMPGTQWVSWIHRADLLGLIEWAMMNRVVSGPVNAVGPNPATMNEFCRTLGAVLKRPSWFPVPEVILKLALGELGSLMTTGQRVAPIVAQSGGYPFQHPMLKEALQMIFTHA